MLRSAPGPSSICTYSNPSGPAHMAKPLSALSQDRCGLHREALVVAWQLLQVAGPPDFLGLIEPTKALPFHAGKRSTNSDCKAPVSACPPG